MLSLFFSYLFQTFHELLPCPSPTTPSFYFIVRFTVFSFHFRYLNSHIAIRTCTSRVVQM